jgi:hypothetical protein
MARLARIVIPGLPHHVTQRGNRREAIFFEDGDHEIYLDLLAEQARKADVAVRAYCLMPNHVYLILKPSTQTTFAAPWAKLTAVPPTSSTPADGGPATCSRAALPPLCWTILTSSAPSVTSA